MQCWQNMVQLCCYIMKQNSYLWEYLIVRANSKFKEVYASFAQKQAQCGLWNIASLVRVCREMLHWVSASTKKSSFKPNSDHVYERSICKGCRCWRFDLPPYSSVFLQGASNVIIMSFRTNEDRDFSKEMSQLSQLPSNILHWWSDMMYM